MRKPKTYGFAERFHGTVLVECFRVKMRETFFYESIETLRSDLDTCLHHYNTERSPFGYRNQGRRPIKITNRFVSHES